MAYTALIDKQLRLAFNQVKDLAKSAVFRQKVSSNFNFASGKTESTSIVQPTTKVVEFDGRKQPRGSKRIVKSLLVKSKEVGDISAYDIVEYDGYTWTIVGTIKGTGFILVLEVAREG